MTAVCRDILNLPSLQGMKLLGGSKGLDRLITWPYVCRTSLEPDCLHGGEFVFVAGLAAGTDTNSLESLVLKGCDYNLAGIVFMHDSESIYNIDKSIIALADRLEFPLFEIPQDCVLAEITKAISNHLVRKQNEYELLHSLLEKTLFGRIEDENKLIEGIRYLGYNLGSENQIAVMHIDGMRETPQSVPLGEILYMEQYIQNLIYRHNSSIMSIVMGSSVILFIPVRYKDEEKKTSGFLDSICCELNSRFPGISVSVGIGEPYSNISELNKSYIEAEKAIKLSDKTKREYNVTRYLDLGIGRLFFGAMDRDEVEVYCDENIGKLVEYDRVNNAELVKTLECYFENLFNISQTAKMLFIHRNSLMYRLSRIEEILDRKLDDPYALLDVVNSVLIRKMVMTR